MFPTAIKTDLTAKTLLRNLGEGVIAINKETRIVLVNKRALKLFGFRESELLGKPLSILLPASIVPLHTQLIHGYLKKPRARRMGIGLDLIARRKDGTEFPVEIGLSHLHIGPDIFAIAFITDITRRKQAEHDLLLRNADLKAFAHTVAHDLNGALTPIIGISQLLAETFQTTSPEIIRSDLEAIAKSSIKMGDIIKHLLTFASMRKEDVKLTPIDTASVIQEAIKRLKYPIHESHAEIIMPRRGFPPALGVAPWAEEIWFNYLSNAIKYGGRPPRIEIGHTLPDKAHILFWVKDNGTGLSKNEQAKIFRPLYQIEHPNAKGYGLGLSIVQRIVSKLGGQTSVQSAPGKGSTFSFTLKRAPSPRTS